jgi:DtxR family transcriptional regulator, Mn-dependent transcriptional regulator
MNNKKLTPSSEDYLETILELSGRKDAVRSVDIAGHLGVSKASVNKAMGILREAGLIEQALYGQIYLTGQGRQQAVEVLQRHSMLKRFLVEILGIEEATAEQDACKMEHVISNSTRDRWLNWLRQVLGGSDLAGQSENKR